MALSEFTFTLPKSNRFGVSISFNPEVSLTEGEGFTPGEGDGDAEGLIPGDEDGDAEGLIPGDEDGDAEGLIPGDGLDVGLPFGAQPQSIDDCIEELPANLVPPLTNL